MLIWWGSRPVKSKVGYVAETCPSCREARVCQLTAYGLRPHVYWLIPVGRTRVQNHMAQCTQCSRRFAVEAAYYSAVLPQPGELGPIKLRTHPSLGSSGQSADDARLQSALRAFLACNGRLSERYAKGSAVIDLRTGLSLASVLAVLISAIWLVGLEHEWIVYLWGSALVFAIVHSIVAMATERRRFVRSKLASALKASFAEQRMHRMDIDRAFQRMQLHNYDIARALDRAWLDSEQDATLRRSTQT